MTMYALQGSPGSGKSSVMVADAAEFLLDGGVVAMNFNLAPNWLDVLCNSSHRYSSGRVDRELFRRSLYDRCFKVGTHDTVIDLGRKLRDITKIKRREGVGRLYIDEGQLLFNSRTYRENMGFIEFFTQHRKLGWDVWVVTHTLDMIDKQIRGLFELETRLRNLQKVKLLGLLPVAWSPVFLAITRYAGISAGAGEIYSRRLYTLSPEYRHLYDTCELFAFNAASRDYTHHGEYTPAPPMVSWRARLAAALSRRLFVPPRTICDVRSASSWPLYHDRSQPGTAAPPSGVTAPSVARPWASW